LLCKIIAYIGFEETNKTKNARNTKNLFFENNEIIKNNKTIPNGETKKGKILCKYINISIT
jgi:hypothetical protein